MDILIFKILISVKTYLLGEPWILGDFDIEWFWNGDILFKTISRMPLIGFIDLGSYSIVILFVFVLYAIIRVKCLCWLFCGWLIFLLLFLYNVNLYVIFFLNWRASIIFFRYLWRSYIRIIYIPLGCLGLRR